MWYLSYAAVCTGLLGSWLLTKKSAWGWALQILAMLIWMTFGAMSGLSIHYQISCLVYIPIYIHGAIKWKKEKPLSQAPADKTQSS